MVALPRVQLVADNKALVAAQAAELVGQVLEAGDVSIVLLSRDVLADILHHDVLAAALRTA